MEGVLPTRGRLLPLAGVTPAPLGATLREHRHQMRPQTSRLGAQRRALQQYGGGRSRKATRRTTPCVRVCL